MQSDVTRPTMQNNAPGLQPEPPASRRDSATRYQLAEATAAAVSPSAPIGSIGVGLEGNGEKKRVGSKDNSEGAGK